MWYLCACALILLVVAGASLRRRRKEAPSAPSPAELFLIKPYLQPGSETGNKTGPQTLEVVWHARSSAGKWDVQYRHVPTHELLTGPWRFARRPASQLIEVESVAGSVRFTAKLAGLPAGEQFEYRVLFDGAEVFVAKAKAQKARGQDFRFVLFGDLAEGGEACRKVAYRSHLCKPDVVIMPGDVVYKRGAVSEYLERYFPIYNSDAAAAEHGAPILRSVLTYAAVGNHDVGMNNVTDVPDLDQHPDLMGFFQFWSLPKNGPVANGSKNVPDLRGTKERKAALQNNAGWRYPRMANYSFDYGDTHWLVLDANAYMDWTDPAFLAWVEDDLAKTDARWKFVCYHQPAFTTDVKHADEQHMRLLCAMFEKHGVDIVFSGHNHTYERNFPLKFKVEPQADGALKDPRGRVKGTFVFDKHFDGVKNTKPNGVLYIVSGGGGAKLYLSPERRADRNALPPYTCKLVDDVHSLTVCDVSKNKLKFVQLSADGLEVDSFTVTK